MEHNFKHLGGKIEVAGSLAFRGGAVLRSPCGVWQHLEMKEALGDQL